MNQTVIALGFFDGVHRGHGALLEKTVQRAQELGAEPMVFTFDRPPKEVVTGKPVFLLNSPEDRQELMKRIYGIDRVLLAPFDREMMTLPWDAFVEQKLVRDLNAVHLVAGHDYHFGYKNQGDPQLLQEKCRELSLGCDIIPKVEVDGITYDCAYVELGDPGIPHAAVPIENLKDYDTQALFQLGRKLRYYKDFPKGANVNFYEIVGPDHVYERTYERGVEDFTYACGTGTGSVVTVLTLLGKVSGKNVRVDMIGGTLYIDVERDSAGRVTDLYLTGPTNIVCKGEITDEELVF